MSRLDELKKQNGGATYESRLDRLKKKVRETTDSYDRSDIEQFEAEYKSFLDSMELSANIAEQQRKASEFKSRLNELKTRYNLNQASLGGDDLELVNRLNRIQYSIDDTFKDFMSSDDFKHYSQIGAGVENPSWNESFAPLDIAGWKPFGDGEEIKNIVTFAEANKSNAIGKSGNNLRAGISSDDKTSLVNFINQYMTKDEKAVYNYYIGKGDTEKASEYLTQLTDLFNQRAADEMVEQADQNALEMVFSGVAGINQWGSGVGNVDNFVKGAEADPTSAIAYARQKMAENNSGVWGVANDLAHTTGNMLPFVVASKAPFIGTVLGLGTMGAGVLGNSYAEMRNQGYDEDVARKYAVGVTVPEMALQYALGGISSLGGKITGKSITKFVSGLDSALARVAVKVPLSMASEGLEEGIQEALEPVIRSLATGEEYEPAQWSDILYSAMLGALSAGVMEGAPTVKGEIKRSSQAKQAFGTPEATSDLINQGLEFAEGTDARKLAEKYKSQVDGGKELSGTKLANLYEANESQYVADDTAKIKTAAESRLTELGEKGDVSRIAEVLTKQATGKKLTMSEKSILKNSQFGQRVSNELNAENIQSGEYSSAWAENIGTKRINPQSYNNPLYKLAEQHAAAMENAEKDSVAKTLAESENATGTKFKASESGKVTYKDADGNPTDVTINKIVSTDGGIKVELDNGETVSASDLEFGSGAEAIMYETVARMGVPVDTANEIIRTFKPTTANQASMYFNNIMLAYKYGTINYEAGLRNVNMSRQEKYKAFELGKKDAFAKAEQATKTSTKTAKADTTKTVKNGIIYEGGFTYDEATANEMQKVSMAHIEVIDKMTNLEVHVFRSKIENGKRVAYVNGKLVKAPNGYFKDGNKIYIDFEAGNNGEGAMLYAMSHEIGHYIRRWNAKGFKELGDFLLEEYGKRGVPVNKLIEDQKKKIKTRYTEENKTLPDDAKLFDMAYEELVCDAMSDMFTDPKAYEKLAKLKQKNRNLWKKFGEAIKAILDKFKTALGIYKTKDVAVAQEAFEVRGFSAEAYEKLQDLYIKAFVEADANYEAYIGSRNLNDFAEAQNENGEPLLQYRAMEADEAEYRSMLYKWGKMTSKQIDNLFATIDNAMELIKDNLEILDYAWEADIDDRAFSPVKPNSDKLYQVSLDFSTLCRKRILQQTVAAQLQEALNKPLTREEGIAIRDALIALQEEGRQIEVACALCYVESARMKSPEQIKRFMNDKEKVIREFFAGKSGGNIKEKIKQAEAEARARLGVGNTSLKSLPGKVAQQIRDAKRAAKESYKPTAEEQKLIEVAKNMTVSDFTSPEGLENLAKHYPALFDAYTSYIRNATKSKGIENDTWWRAGDSMKIGDVLIANMNKENGLRSQSWSDFQVIHILDYIASTIELATRNTKEQAYSKVPDYVELMGNTGVMINMSLIPTATFNGSLDYDSVEGIDYKRALELRDKYHATAGTICIGVDNVQIQLLLADTTIDYVIPYHKSGMSKALRKLMHLPTWSDYELYQSESKLSRADAEKQAKKYGVKLLDASDPNYQKSTSFSEWFDLTEAQQIAKMENANPTDKAKQKKYGVMYGGYMAMQNAANNYLKLCAERGLAPKFSHENANFTAEENYWKLLIDRKMVDNVTGEVIEQQTIKPIFNEGEIMRILNDELARYPKVKEDQDYAIRTVTERMLSGEVKGGMSAKAIAEVMKKPVDNVANVNILASSEDISDEDIHYSFRDSKNGMANDALSPYDEELTRLIEQRGDYIVDSFDKLKHIVNLAFDNPNHKATAYFGVISAETLENIKNSIPNLAKAIEGILFKQGRDYSIATTFDSIRHLADEKNLSREEVIDYLDRLADTVIEFDSVAFDFYIKGNSRTPGLLFKKAFPDGIIYNFNLVSNKKKILSMHSLYLDSANYQKKKSAKTLPMQNASGNTSKTQVSQTPVNSIPQVPNSVNSEFSEDEMRSDRDSNGNELSAEQQEYFKDSKVRDKDGNLMVVYHGSPSEFTIFKSSKIGAHGNAHGKGFYFTENEGLASSFYREGGQLLKGYLDIKNPMSEEKVTIKKPELIKLIKAICEEEAQHLVKDDAYGSIREALPDTFISNYVYTYGMSITDAYREVADIVYSNCDNDVDIIGEMYNAGARGVALEKAYEVLGYDGAIYTHPDGVHEYVSFVSNQFKSITNKAPTSDPDIRFADRDTASYAPTFYSHMGKVIDGIRLEKMGAGGVVSYLKGKGVKDEEIKWSGIGAFLEGKKSVTKTELQEFVVGSQLKIEEEGSSDTIETRYKSDNELVLVRNGEDQLRFEWDEDEAAWKTVGADDWFADEDEILDAAYTGYGATKWSEYKLEGGTNYRELVFKMPNSTYSNRAMRVHWGEDAEGVLAHARIQDFIVNGKKMLFIEELQSDWHNEGLQKGYSTEEYEDAVAVYDKLANEHQKVRTAFNKYVRSSEFRSDSDEVGKKKFDWLRGKVETAEKRMQDAERYVNSLKEKGMGDVADAPFRSTYHEYVLKRLLRMAAEEGYDSIGWTPSDIQSDRWSDEFAEAYRIEYDQDMPKFLRKYGKKWGATVGKTALPFFEPRATYYDVNRREDFNGFLEWQDEVERGLRSQGVNMRNLKYESDDMYWIAFDKVSGIEYDRAEIRKTSGSVWSMDITDSMTESVLYEGQVMYSDRVTDKKTLDFLENQEHIITYKSFVEIDGKLYSPMATKVKGDDGKYRLTNPSEIGVWQQAEEKPDSIPKFHKTKGYGYYVLKKDDGGTITAAYNPYEHSSNLVLNDQFEAAYQRPNLVTVECIIPKSEMTSGYKAKYAKDSTGYLDWKSGTVAGKLKGNKRKVYLSRWLKPVRILSDAEVASMYKDILGSKISVPFNVVTPQLLTELEKVGVKIDYEGSPGYQYRQSKKSTDTDTKLSDRDPDAVSNRSLLANALESVASNDIEKNKLKQYKDKIALIDAAQKKLSEIKAQANELRFTKGRNATETKQMNDLDAEATRIANRISTYDKQLLDLEATTALKNVLNREKTKLRKRLEQKGKEALKAQKERNAETIREILTRNTESRKNAIEGRHKTEMRHKIKNVVSDLNKLLLNPTKDKHVPIGLQKVVAEALDVINMDTMNAEERVAYYNALIAKSTNPDEIAMLTKKRDFFEYRDANFKDRITALKSAYAEFKESDDPLIRNAHNEAIEDLIKNTADGVGNKSLKDMSLAQLESVYNMYKAILATVRNTNKMFKEDIKESVSENSEAVKTEVKEVGGHKDRVLKILKSLKKFGWDMLKPVTAMKAIGSKTFAKLFDNVRAGEDTWAVDINEAKKFYDDMSAKYGYKKWDFKKRYNFKDSAGTDFSLSLEQIMSLYAYSKREQADKHLEFGGFIFDDAIEITEKKLGIPFKYEVNDANPYRLRKEDLLAVTDALTKEQRGFIDEMQTYLSDVMGAKGNEVSLAMYDIKLYNEKNYFPLKTSRYFREFDPEKSGTPKIKNSGFSKKTVPQAGNPIVLSNFMDVWATHVNDMSMYHAFVLPLEDFLRVYNYSSTAGGYDSVQQYIKNAYGAQANQYIEKLMDDLNGGARVDSSAGVINKGLALFKKASVFASASVVVQQPSAIARAFAYINPKYFVTSAGSALNLAKHKSVWAEVKKYAPVAVIKEMGYFDTGMGRSTVEWIKGNQTVKDKVDDALSKAPAMADELSWTYIWLAVKRETAAKGQFKAGSENFLKECGRRFTEVITNTQVYDSVLSRSGMMRSKDTGMKMATAFMAEPTTTVNMIVDGIIQGKRGNKKFTASTVGAVSASIILNSILVALVYAARDDDEDETYAEKYVGSLTSELLDGFNPLTYVPFVKDVWSIAQGYDVERSDMSVVSKLWESVEGLFNENKSGWEKVAEASGAVSSLFGFPLKNIIRDAKAMYNLTKTITDDTPTTEAGISASVEDAFKSSIPLWDRLHETDTNSDRLYEAIMSGDQDQIDRIKSRFKNEDAIESAMRAGLREHDSRIKEAAQARLDGNISEYTRIAKEIVAEGNFSQDIVVGAINAEMTAIKKGESTESEPTEDKDEATSYYKASDINVAFDNEDTSLALEIIDDLIETKVANGMDEKSAKSSVRSSMTSYWKPLYKAAYQSGDSTEMTRIRRILYTSGLYGTANDVVKTVKNWLKD